MTKPISEESQDKWNQILFDNANKCHTHQDNLRWTLSGGFAAFFYGSIILLHNERVAPDLVLTHNLHLLFFILGTLYWIAISVEGWYYNLYLRYLIECEERIILGQRLYPLAKFDRKNVKMFHPSFSPVLILIAAANSYHLYSFYSSKMLCASYVLISTIISIKGHLFKRVEMTKSNNSSILGEDDTERLIEKPTVEENNEKQN